MKTIWIVDGGYISAFGRGSPWRLDMHKLKRELESLNGSKFVSSYFFHSCDDPKRTSFFNWLRVVEPRGPQMTTEVFGLKSARCQCPECKVEFQRPVQKGVDVALATMLIKLAHENAYDRVVLTAGDSDFVTALHYVTHDLGKQLWINGSDDPRARTSRELRKLASNFIALEPLNVVRVRN